jgi:NADH-quinone oxidoreductase subunit M
VLTLVLLIPLVGFAILLAIPSRSDRTIRLWANGVFLAGLFATLPLIFSFDRTRDFQFVERLPWIPSIGATYHIGVDGMSLLFVFMTALIGFLAVLSSWNAVAERQKEYYAFFLLQQVGMLGVFVARDLFLFFLFWEMVLIPMYFIIAIWGGPRRAYAAIKFVIYTMLGSVLMLLGILTLYWHHFQQQGVYSFDMADLMRTALPVGVEWWVFWAFFLGFAVKVPMFPFHTWLPDAHVEAPTAGSVVLASVLLKLGTYGLLRFSVPLLPSTARDAATVKLIALLSIIAIIYGAFVCLMQKDMKKLVAYSSVSHMGYCTLGIFTLNPMGIAGSILQQVNHAISTGMLFLLVGVVYERKHSREIAAYGGLLRVMPVFTFVFLITALSSMGMPPLNGFIGELTILQGAYQENYWWAIWAAIGIALGAAYLIWLFQRVSLGETAESNLTLTDMSRREIAVFAPLLIWAVAIGIYPRPYFDLLARPVAQIVERVHPGYYDSHKLPNPLVSPGAAAAAAR